VVGGIDRIPGFVSLFRGNGLHIAAIVDVQQGQKQKIENATKSLKENHLLTQNTFAGQDEADIEDVLGRVFFRALLTKSLDLRPPHEFPTDKPGGAPSRIAKEADDFAATLPPHYSEFNHFVPARWLFEHKDEGKTLDGYDEALKRMGTLIAAANALMEPSGPIPPK